MIATTVTSVRIFARTATAQPMGGDMALQRLGESDLQPDIDGRQRFEPKVTHIASHLNQMVPPWNTTYAGTLSPIVRHTLPKNLGSHPAESTPGTHLKPAEFRRF